MTRIRITAWLMVAATFALAVAAFTSCAPANKPATETQPAAATPTPLERGQYLVTVGGCVDCHTPGALFGAPDFNRNLSGSELGWNGPWGTTYARNLTPDPETGLGRYKAEEIVGAIKGGKRLDGTPMLPPMPWQNYAAMSDEDLNAVAAYLLSLPPVKHAVPDRVAPGMKPAGSYLPFPAPSAWDVPPAAGAGGGGH